MLLSISIPKFQFYYILPFQKPLYHSTMSFYNNSSIPNFYFPILLIKIIYLHNKFFFPIFSSTFPQPLSPHLHCPVTTTTSPPCPLLTAHQNPTETKTHIKNKKKTHSVTHAEKNAKPRPRRPSTTKTSPTKHEPQGVVWSPL